MWPTGSYRFKSHSILLLSATLSANINQEVPEHTLSRSIDAGFKFPFQLANGSIALINFYEGIVPCTLTI